MTDLAIVLVHYRTEALLVEAVRALEADLSAANLRAEIVVVDNGSDPERREEWSELPVRRIDPGENLGYAGGVKCGVEATPASLLVAMNPDVVVSSGCLALLLAELERGAAAAGPQFFWDRARRLLLPPTEKHSAGADLRAALARRFPARESFVGATRRAWRAHAHRHWEARAPIVSTSLSGALLAFRRDAWARVGPFDEAFPLYFEETDWLLRLASAGFETRYVPAAEAVHLFAQSSVQEPRATAWFAEAERRFRRRHYGRTTTWFLERLRGRSSARSADAGLPVRDRPHLTAAELATPQPVTWIEVALSPAGFPAASERRVAPAADWQLPEEIWNRLPPGELWLRGVDESGGETAAWRCERAAGSGAAGG